MHLTVISGSTRAEKKSNTAKIIAAFLEGFCAEGNTAEVFYLSDRKQWQGAREAFQAGDHILFAFPLYVENIPGTMLEFLETLPKKVEPGAQLAFLVQGGFPEASQLRCCESFLETLPGKFNCAYAGTLLKGDMFGVGLMGKKLGAQMTAPFIEAGRNFCRTSAFAKAEADAFAGPEYFSEADIQKFNGFGKKAQKFFMGLIAKKLGCKKKLDDQPYKSSIR